MSDESAQGPEHPEPVVDPATTPIVKREESAKGQSSWIVAKTHDAKGSLYVRFNYGMRHVAKDPSYTKMIIFETLAVESKDVDEYLASLDRMEDAVKKRMESIDGCVLLLTRSGAGFRDLLFAYKGTEKEFETPIRTLRTEFPERMSVSVTEPDWSLYNALADRVKNRSKD